MTDTSVKNSGSRKLSSRLQLRAPASIKISPATDWNVAIPLLSPLAASPKEAESKQKKEESRRDSNKCCNSRQEKAPVMFKKWQHPAAAAPFCYESGPLKPFFQLTAVSDRA